MRRALRKRRSLQGLLRPSAVARPLAQSEAVQDAARMVGIVAHAEHRENRLGETRGSPAVGIQAYGPRPRPIDFRRGVELLRIEAAGTARRPPFAERLNASTV